MLKRIANHYVGIKTKSLKKYQILSKLQGKGYSIDFDVLYYATATEYSALLDEIGKKEAEYINQYKPVLNTQYPRLDNWHKYKVCTIDENAILNSF